MGLVLPQTVEICWTPANKEHFINKGFEFTKYKEKFVVDVLDLKHNSHIEVKFECDRCHEIFSRPIRIKNSINRLSDGNLYYCQVCYNNLIGENGLHPRRYWAVEENALRELDSYIKKHGKISSMTNNSEGSRISASLNNHRYSIIDMCEKLGYKYEDLVDWNSILLSDMDFEIIKERALGYYNAYGVFPKQKQFQTELKIPISRLKKYGSFNEIKKMILGNENDLLEDDRGFINRSHYEYMVAQFLIHNGIDYLREQNPFPKPHSGLRSDFTFFKDNGIAYHVEVWGYKETDDESSRSCQYNYRKKIKLGLYDKYNINLISIESSSFDCCYDSIQNNLRNIFQNFLNIKTKNIDNKYLINPNKLSDKELLEAIMEYSDDERFLPQQAILMDKAKTLFYEMIKRYKNQNNFAKKFNKLTYSKVGLWDVNLVVRIMDYMIDTYGHLITSNDLKTKDVYKSDKMLIGFLNGAKKIFGSNVDAYLYYYENCVINNIELSNTDLDYIKDLLRNRYFKPSVTTPERIEKAKYILENIIGRKRVN